ASCRRYRSSCAVPLPVLLLPSFPTRRSSDLSRASPSTSRFCATRDWSTTAGRGGGTSTRCGRTCSRRWLRSSRIVFPPMTACRRAPAEIPTQVPAAPEVRLFFHSSQPGAVIGGAMRPDLREIVRGRYGRAAPRVVQGQASGGCCGSDGCCGSSDPITSDLYDAATAAALPEAAVLASLGCGNPTALAELSEGEVVLDLGSGGGIDVLLSAQRVGPSGKAYGLDMTDEMLELARKNAAAAG